MIKNLLLASLLAAGIASAQLPPPTFPWTSAGYFCTPAGCFQTTLIPPYGFGQALVDGVMYCSNGDQCMVRGGVQAIYCSLPKALDASVAYGSSQTYLQYNPLGYYQLVYAATLQGQGEIYTYSGGWARTYYGYELSDCYTGNTRNYYPSSSPC